MSVKDRLTEVVDVAERNSRTTKFAAWALLGFVFIVLVPMLATNSEISILTRMFIWGLFAMGYDFMFGYSGMVSFGHAALFGLGAYAFAMPVMHFGPQSVWLLLFLAVLTSTVYAFVVGVISIRTREVYFAILTLAFAEVMYIVVINFTDVTGGFDGIVFTLPELTVVPGVLSVSLYDVVPMYYLVIGLVTVTFLILRRLANSPMGAVLRGVRENVDRLEYIGIDERRYRIAAFTISGAVSGLAGGLFAADLSFAGPETLFFVLSGEVIVWTIIGGAGTLWGPLLGGALIFFVEETVSGYITWWLIPVGILFIAMVIFMPEGMAGKLTDFIDRYRDGKSESKPQVLETDD